MRYHVSIVVGCALMAWAMVAFAVVTWPDAVHGIIGTFLP